jgi:hemerythrin-like domain-containing protein
MLDLLSGCHVPVLVMSAGNQPDAMPAIATIRDEHRSLAAVLHAWLHLARRACRENRLPDVELMQAMLRYLRDFPLALHHPKEEEFLFARLRARTAKFDAELRELTRQHEHDRQLVAELADAVARSASGQASAAEIESLVGRYALFVWEHMGREEGVIIPAAQRHLTADDWAATNAAFAENRDPRFGEDTAAEFRTLYARIVALSGADAEHL